MHVFAYLQFNIVQWLQILGISLPLPYKLKHSKSHNPRFFFSPLCHNHGGQGPSSSICLSYPPSFEQRQRRNKIISKENPTKKIHKMLQFHSHPSHNTNNNHHHHLDVHSISNQGSHNSNEQNFNHKARVDQRCHTKARIQRVTNC